MTLVRRVRLFAFLLLLLMMALIVVPWSPANAVYCAVTDPARAWPGVQDEYVTPCESATRFWPDHLVRDGKLYLKVQEVRYNFLLPFVSFGDWDAEKVGAFRRLHPELDGYWPAPGLPDGGVTWLRRTPR
jgi:hypothetical protein